MQEESREFQERKKLIEMQKEADRTKHGFKIEELEMERANSNLMHEQILERGRIQRAEQRKMFFERRENG